MRRAMSSADVFPCSPGSPQNTNSRTWTRLFPNISTPSWRCWRNSAPSPSSGADPAKIQASLSKSELFSQTFRRLRPVSRAELAADIPKVFFHRRQLYPWCPCDLFVRDALHQQPRHILFPSCQLSIYLRTGFFVCTLSATSLGGKEWLSSFLGPNFTPLCGQNR